MKWWLLRSINWSPLNWNTWRKRTKRAGSKRKWPERELRWSRAALWEQPVACKVCRKHSHRVLRKGLMSPVEVRWSNDRYWRSGRFLCQLDEVILASLWTKWSLHLRGDDFSLSLWLGERSTLSAGSIPSMSGFLYSVDYSQRNIKNQTLRIRKVQINGMSLFSG